ncbi:Uncharacterised protein [Mycobacteroides abscessus subsp. abscessus]|nr:Uncharacterised protein [Mycobacteroides abscessus subsp. abscessus]
MAHRRDRGRVGHLDHPVDHLPHERRLHPRTADALDARRHPGLIARVTGLVAAVEGGVLRVDHRQLGGVPAIADVAADGGAGSAGARAHHDPFRHRMGLQPQLVVDALGDVVVAAPVGGPFGVGELVHVVPAALGRQARGLGVHLRRASHEVTAAALGLDQRDLLRRGIRRHHRDEIESEQLGEIRLAHRRRPRGRLHDRGALGDPAVADRVQEQRAGQPVLQAAGDVGGLVLEVQLDVPRRGQRVAEQMGVGAALGVGVDQAHRVVHPVARDAAVAELHRRAPVTARRRLRRAAAPAAGPCPACAWRRRPRCRRSPAPAGP